ncbi:hypothetical protein BDZ91DRAFT_754421 [Kalaharituber pfeilii]|nr:hypothetical protein BDZ91DRAFT_754421 [Kalaharituber pfeilii]
MLQASIFPLIYFYSFVSFALFLEPWSKIGTWSPFFVDTIFCHVFLRFIGFHSFHLSTHINSFFVFLSLDFTILPHS